MQRCLKATCFLVLGLLHFKVCRTSAKQSLSTLHWNQPPPPEVQSWAKGLSIISALKHCGSFTTFAPISNPSPNGVQSLEAPFHFTSLSCNPDTIQDIFKTQCKPFLLCPGLTSPACLNSCSSLLHCSRLPSWHKGNKSPEIPPPEPLLRASCSIHGSTQQSVISDTRSSYAVLKQAIRRRSGT